MHRQDFQTVIRTSRQEFYVAYLEQTALARGIFVPLFLGLVGNHEPVSPGRQFRQQIESRVGHHILIIRKFHNLIIDVFLCGQECEYLVLRQLHGSRGSLDDQNVQLFTVHIVNPPQGGLTRGRNHLVTGKRVRADGPAVQLAKGLVHVISIEGFARGVDGYLQPRFRLEQDVAALVFPMVLAILNKILILIQIQASYPIGDESVALHRLALLRPFLQEGDVPIHRIVGSKPLVAHEIVTINGQQDEFHLLTPIQIVASKFLINKQYRLHHRGVFRDMQRHSEKLVVMPKRIACE